MAANFWASTHYRNWLRNAETVFHDMSLSLKRDQPLFNEDELTRIKVVYAQTISTLARKASLRQRVAATAIVYFKRFYVRNAIRDHDPRLIAPVALYLAAKAEEHTLPAKIVVAQMTAMYTGDHPYPYTVAHVYDYEFKMIAALDFDLIIFHPYRPMVQYCADASLTSLLASAWPILNDSFRTDACLLYPPYLIAIACIFMAGTLQDMDMSQWVSSLNVDTQDLADVTQQLSSLYTSNPIPATGPHVDTINNKFQVHFGSKIHPVSAPVSKRPPSSSRPKGSSTKH